MTLMVQKGALGERVKIFLGKQSSVYLHQEKNETLKLHDHFDLESPPSLAYPSSQSSIPYKCFWSINSPTFPLSPYFKIPLLSLQKPPIRHLTNSFSPAQRPASKFPEKPKLWVRTVSKPWPLYTWHPHIPSCSPLLSSSLTSLRKGHFRAKSHTWVWLLSPPPTKMYFLRQII